MQENSGAAGAGVDTSNLDAGGDRARRTPTELMADLLREKALEEAKVRDKFDRKIAKARKSATPIGERRRAALDFLDRMRDSYRTAFGDILLEDAVADREIANIFIGALNANTVINPAALDAALLVLDRMTDDDAGAPEGDGAAAGNAGQYGQGGQPQSGLAGDLLAGDQTGDTDQAPAASGGVSTGDAAAPNVEVHAVEGAAAGVQVHAALAE